MIIYLDNDFKCHLENDGTMRAVETDFFDGKCRQYIEGYRFVPADETWTREDGIVFVGIAVNPWRDYNILKEFQSQYEEMLEIQNDMSEALNVLGVRMEE